MSEREPSPYEKQEYKDEPIEHISPKDEVDEDESKHVADELITEKLEKPLDLGKYFSTFTYYILSLLSNAYSICMSLGQGFYAIEIARFL